MGVKTENSSVRMREPNRNDLGRREEAKDSSTSDPNRMGIWMEGRGVNEEGKRKGGSEVLYRVHGYPRGDRMYPSFPFFSASFPHFLIFSFF